MRKRSSARGTRVSACGDVSPHAEHRSPHAETVLRTRKTSLRMRKRFSARGDGPPHAENESPHAETILRTRNTSLRTRNTSLRMRKRFSACGSTRHAEDNEKSAVLGFRSLVLKAEVRVLMIIRLLFFIPILVLILIVVTKMFFKLSTCCNRCNLWIHFRQHYTRNLQGVADEKTPIIKLACSPERGYDK